MSSVSSDDGVSVPDQDNPCLPPRRRTRNPNVVNPRNFTINLARHFLVQCIREIRDMVSSGAPVHYVYVQLWAGVTLDFSLQKFDAPGPRDLWPTRVHYPHYSIGHARDGKPVYIHDLIRDVYPRCDLNVLFQQLYPIVKCKLNSTGIFVDLSDQRTLDSLQSF